TGGCGVPGSSFEHAFPGVPASPAGRVRARLRGRDGPRIARARPGNNLAAHGGGTGAGGSEWSQCSRLPGWRRERLALEGRLAGVAATLLLALAAIARALRLDRGPR